MGLQRSWWIATCGLTGTVILSIHILVYSHRALSKYITLSFYSAIVHCCRLVNKLIPGFVKKINTKGGNFALMENLAAVQKGMRAYGLPEDELFQTADLFEARNVKAVVKSLTALARLVIRRLLVCFDCRRTDRHSNTVLYVALRGKQEAKLSLG